MVKPRGRGDPVTTIRGAAKVEKVKPVERTITVVPAEDDVKDCAAVEPTVMFEEYDIRKDATPTENDPADLFNCKSYMFTEETYTESNDSHGTSPTYVVEEFDETNSGNFLQTFKTLVDISINSNNDCLGSISSTSDDENDGNNAPFDILGPIRTTSYNIMKTSTRFLSSMLTDDSKSQATESETKSKDVEAPESSWSIDRLTKWL